MRKRLSLCLISALLLSQLLTFQAAAKTVITATTYIPDIVIDVVVPESGTTYINPTKLPVQVGTSRQVDQILTETCYIRNMSEVPVQVNAEIYGKINSGSDIYLVTESTVGSTATRKNVFMYFEMLAVDDMTSSVPWAAEFDANRHIVVRTSAKSYNNVSILGAGGEEKSYGAFRLAGDCIEDPKSGWNGKDGVTVNIAFTFKPRPIGTEIP